MRLFIRLLFPSSAKKQPPSFLTHLLWHLAMQIVHVLTYWPLRPPLICVIWLFNHSPAAVRWVAVKQRLKFWQEACVWKTPVCTVIVVYCHVKNQVNKHTDLKLDLDDVQHHQSYFQETRGGTSHHLMSHSTQFLTLLYCDQGRRRFSLELKDTENESNQLSLCSNSLI